MDFLHGRTLQSIVQAGLPVPLRRMAPIVLQCCRALQAAHEHGIIHRDFKPDNVFLIDQGERTDFVKLVDFGIAKLNESSGGSHTQTGAVMGTPAYMSPEQAGGEPVIDARSDVYSLGITMFQMACGRLPFADAGPSFGKLLAAHLQQPPPRPRSINPDVPEELEAIILKTLEKDPARRFQSMSELHDGLLVCMEALGVDTELPRIGETDDRAHPEAVASAYRSGVVATPARGATVARTQRVTPTPQPPRQWRAGLAIGIGAGIVLAGAALAWWRLRPTPVDTAPPVRVNAQAASPTTPPSPAPAPPPSSASQPPSSASSPAGSASQRPLAASERPAPPSPERTSTPDARPRSIVAQRTPAPAAHGQRSPPLVEQVPQKTAVSFRCGGPQEVCGPLRAALDDALGKAAFRSVRDPSRADVQVEATVAGTQGRTSSQFGTTFAVRTYSIDLAAEATRTSEAIAMPSSAPLGYDPSFGSERVAEKARVLAVEIVDAVQAFTERQRR